MSDYRGLIEEMEARTPEEKAGIKRVVVTVGRRPKLDIEEIVHDDDSSRPGRHAWHSLAFRSMEDPFKICREYKHLILEFQKGLHWRFFDARIAIIDDMVRPGASGEPVENRFCVVFDRAETVTTS